MHKRGAIYINRANINDYLLLRIPELKDIVDEIAEDWYPCKVPSHVMYGDSLAVFLFDLLKSKGNNVLLITIFDFLEEMSNCEDEYVVNLLQISVLEYLWGDFEVLRCAYGYMGVKTKMLSNELQLYFQPFSLLQ